MSISNGSQCDFIYTKVIQTVPVKKIGLDAKLINMRGRTKPGFVWLECPTCEAEWILDLFGLSAQHVRLSESWISLA